MLASLRDPSAPDFQRRSAPMPPAPHRVRSAVSFPVAVLLVPAITLMMWIAVASAAPVLGFVEHFAGTSTGSWASGNGITNPGAGGALGAGDGFLLLSTPGQNSNLGGV